MDTDGDRKEAERPPRPFIGVLFRCCRIYQRVYIHPDGTRYEGRCPRCLGLVEVRIGPDGTEERIFEAS